MHIDEKIKELSKEYETPEEVMDSSTSLLGPFYINKPHDGQHIQRDLINLLQLPTGMKAVYYRRGKAVKVLDHGWYIIPGIFKFWGKAIVLDTRTQIIDLPSTSLPTADGFQVNVDSVARLTVTNPF